MGNMGKIRMKRKRRKEKKERKAGFAVSAVLLFFISVFSIFGTVTAGNGMSRTEKERYYRVKEKELVEETRIFLNGNGYSNSGISLTRVTDEGSRSYTMTIHHGRIDRMSQEERRALKRQLEQQSIPEELGSLQYVFMHDEG